MFGLTKFLFRVYHNFCEQVELYQIYRAQMLNTHLHTGTCSLPKQGSSIVFVCCFLKMILFVIYNIIFRICEAAICVPIHFFDTKVSLLFMCKQR